MYKANISFVTKSYSVREGEILEDDFTTENEIQEYLDIGYIAEYNGNIAITENGTYDVSNYGTADVDVSIIKVIEGIKLGSTKLKEIPDSLIIDISETTDLGNFFFNSNLITAPALETAHITNMSSMFSGSFGLIHVPLYDTSSVSTMFNMFKQASPDNDSLNNILQMCINATNYGSTKTLKALGISSLQATTCQSLSNYQAFIDAGWTTGY